MSGGNPSPDIAGTRIWNLCASRLSSSLLSISIAPDQTGHGETSSAALLGFEAINGTKRRRVKSNCPATIAKYHSHVFCINQ